MDASELRAHFPVLERIAYLNAGTDGPVPDVAVEAAAEELRAEARDGRVTAHFERRIALQDELRAAYGRVVGAPPEQIALTTSASDGLGRVLAGLRLGEGDEVVTSDQEHPGLLAPLLQARRNGASVREVPWAEVPTAVSDETTLVALSHVNWLNGDVIPPGLSELSVPLVLDGAQGAGAVPVDVRSLGCAAYAAAGQKWLCGPDGSGFLWLDPSFAERLDVVTPSYLTFEDAAAGLDGEFKATAQRFDTPTLAREALAMSAAAMRLFEEMGLEAVHDRAATLARRLADELRARDREVAPRGHTTLVAWAEEDDEAVRDRLAGDGVIVRNLPGRNLLRASIGAWNDESDLERLLDRI
jgi:L-cysteine/cystine lyase